MTRSKTLKRKAVYIQYITTISHPHINTKIDENAKFNFQTIIEKHKNK